MNQIACPRCEAVLDYSGPRPAFCSQCGQALGRPAPPATPVPPATGPLPAGTASPEPIPEVIGGCRLLRQIGEGGMGTVHEAEDLASGRRVAVKLIRGEFAESPEAVARFRREGRVASLVTHPCCVFVFRADEEAGHPYIVMELMPGTTLQDVLDREGPLPVARAVGYALDVIEGLQEAHRLGVIHRDVKPSNCFLLPDGRVKVGDFGLARSLLAGQGLTRTGTFLGTMLYASPEQVRGQALDAQTDVYSVAATLFCLLTGRPPFEGRDAAATLASIIADPVPSPRRLRPEVPPALDETICRGLERQRERRWHSLEEFRQALLPLVRTGHPAWRPASRLAAHLVDFVLLATLDGVVTWLRGGPDHAYDPWDAPIWFVYFTLFEGLCGWSPGKALFGLRVRRAEGNRPPGLVRAALRFLVYYALVWGTWEVVSALVDWSNVGRERPFSPLELWWGWLAPAGILVGTALLLAPMRARNGYRGLLELISGTRVEPLAQPAPAPMVPAASLLAPVPPPHGAPERLGPFAIRGLVADGAGGRVLLAEDEALGRQVLLWLRPPSEPPLPDGRCAVSRLTRLRWLAGGHDAAARWDAFLLPQALPLTRLVAGRGPQPWAVVLPLLEQLAEELAAAGKDGTLPPSLGLDQVWISARGRVELLDFSLGVGDGPGAGDDPAGETAFLVRVARLLLEGRPRAGGDATGPVRVPLPVPAARLLARLDGDPGAALTMREVQAELASLREGPAAVTRGIRLVQTMFLLVLLVPAVLGFLFWMSEASAIPFAELDLHHVRPGEKALREIQAGSAADLVAAAADPNPWMRLRAVAQFAEDHRLGDLLSRQLERQRCEEAARRDTLSAPAQAVVLGVEANLQSRPDWDPDRMPRPVDFRENAGAALMRSTVGIKQFEIVFSVLAVAWLLGWLGATAVIAFVARGGLTLRLAGIAVVRRDGRKAGRLRCATRALLAALPVAGLLLLCVVLYGGYWRVWDDGGPAWMLTLASVCWYAAAALPIFYLGLALRSPARGLHDWLTGTCLVPR
jgi:hypothetical protein